MPVRPDLPHAGGQHPRVPRADAVRNQRRILRAAARLLAEDPAASMQRIADAAEVARPTVYRRYPNRDALVRAILEQALDDLAAALRELRDEGPPGGADDRTAQRLADHLRAFARVAVDYPVLTGFRPAPHTHADGGDHGGHLTGWDEVAGAFGDLIRGAQAEATVRPDIRPDVLLLAFTGALDMALQPARRGGDPDTINQVAGQVVDMFLNGIRAR